MIKLLVLSSMALIVGFLVMDMRGGIADPKDCQSEGLSGSALCQSDDGSDARSVTGKAGEIFTPRERTSGSLGSMTGNQKGQHVNETGSSTLHHDAGTMTRLSQGVHYRVKCSEGSASPICEGYEEDGEKR